MIDLSDKDRLMRKTDLVTTDMDGDLVMMSLEKGEYYGVGGVGPRVWELLGQPVSIEQITTVICSEFDVEPDRCLEEMRGFVRQLLDMGLIQRVVA